MLGEHPFPGEETEQCHNCHDPHAPGDGAADAETPVAETGDTITPDISPGLADIVSKCAKCHGDQGEGRKKNPAIAGLESGAFIDLMNLYVSGAREHKAMNKSASALSAEEILQLSAYYEQLSRGPTD